jgi:hypothetical protein
MRWNTLKVLRQLSEQGLKEEKDNIMALTAVRAPLMKATKGTTIGMSLERHALEGSGNLFYYLFEDYSAAVQILISAKAALKFLVSLFTSKSPWFPFG